MHAIAWPEHRQIAGKVNAAPAGDRNGHPSSQGHHSGG